MLDVISELLWQQFVVWKGPDLVKCSLSQAWQQILFGRDRLERFRSARFRNKFSLERSHLGSSVGPRSGRQMLLRLLVCFF